MSNEFDDLDLDLDVSYLPDDEPEQDAEAAPDETAGEPKKSKTMLYAIT